MTVYDNRNGISDEPAVEATAVRDRNATPERSSQTSLSSNARKKQAAMYDYYTSSDDSRLQGMLYACGSDVSDDSTTTSTTESDRHCSSIAPVVPTIESRTMNRSSNRDAFFFCIQYLASTKTAAAAATAATVVGTWMIAALVLCAVGCMLVIPMTVSLFMHFAWISTPWLVAFLRLFYAAARMMVLLGMKVIQWLVALVWELFLWNAKVIIGTPKDALEFEVHVEPEFLIFSYQYLRE